MLHRGRILHVARAAGALCALLRAHSEPHADAPVLLPDRRDADLRPRHVHRPLVPLRQRAGKCPPKSEHSAASPERPLGIIAVESIGV